MSDSNDMLVLKALNLLGEGPDAAGIMHVSYRQLSRVLKDAIAEVVVSVREQSQASFKQQYDRAQALEVVARCAVEVVKHKRPRWRDLSALEGALGRVGFDTYDYGDD